MDNTRYIVYRHTSPNNKVYIGITCRKVSIRWANGNGYTNNKHFSNAIKKYGWENFKHEILFNKLTEKEAKLMEQIYISLHDSANTEKGYNQTLGGDGTKGYHMSNETKDKIREAFKKRYTKENHPNYGKRLPEETRNKISRAHRNKIVPKEPKVKTRKKHADVKGINNPRCRKIICLTTGEVFDYIKEASLKYNIKQQSGITACCKNRVKSAGKLSDETPLIWMYYEDFLNMSVDNTKDLLQSREKHEIICLNDLNIFKSLKKAGDFYNIKNPSNIGKCCKGEVNHCGKLPNGTPLKWMYYNDYIEKNK